MVFSPQICCRNLVLTGEFESFIGPETQMICIQSWNYNCQGASNPVAKCSFLMLLARS